MALVLKILMSHFCSKITFLKPFFIILGGYLETELWEQIKQNYSGFPKPLNGPLKVHIDVDTLQILDVVSTRKLLALFVVSVLNQHCTKKTFFIKYFFSKCDQIRSFLQIWSHLLKKSLMENIIFCAVLIVTNLGGRQITADRNSKEFTKRKKRETETYSKN